jgi:hypothetical protein
VAQSQREILDFSPFGFAAKADASGVDLKVPTLRFVRMTTDAKPRAKISLLNLC